MSNETRFRVAVVGAGHISPFHLAAIARIPDAQVLGIVDLDTARVRQLAQRFRLPEKTASLKELVQAGINTVHVATPPGTHCALTCQALELGCDVFVEKPLATSVAECEQIGELANSVGKQVCVNHSNLRDPFVAKALSMVREGRIGNVLSVTYLRSSNYPPYLGGPLPPHYREGGFPFRDIGVHALYMIREFLGEIADVHAVYAHRGEDQNLFFDEWNGMVNCEKGVGHFQLSWNVRPIQNVLIVQGTKGVLRCDPFSMYVTSKRTTRLPNFVERVANSLKEGVQIGTQVPWNLGRFVSGRLRQYHGVQETIAAFYDSLRTDSKVPTPVAEAIPMVRWTEEVACSADSEKQSHLQKFSKRQAADVLVTGAMGFIGRHLLNRLLETHDRVRVLVRRTPPQELIEDPRVDVVIGDLGNPAVVDEAVHGVEMVYHLGAAMKGPSHDFERGTEAGTRNLVDSILRHGRLRLVYVSSLSVLHSSRARRDDTLTEQWPLEPHPEKRGDYTLFKLRAEKIVSEAVRENGLEAIILRPGQVFGPGGEVLTPAVARPSGNRLIVLGNGTVPLPLVYVEDLVDALTVAGKRGPFDGTIIHLVDDAETYNQNQLLDRLFEGKPTRPQIRHIPRIAIMCLAFAVQTGFRILGRRPPLSVYRIRSALSPMRFNCDKARKLLGWRPRVGVTAGLRQMACGSQLEMQDSVDGTEQGLECAATAQAVDSIRSNG